MTDMRTDEVALPVCLPDPRPSDPLEALSWLGETEEEVVKSLRERGIKGTHSIMTCPIAVFLQTWWDEACAVGPYVRKRSGIDPEIPVPRHIEQFVMSFDNGRYPDLDRHK